MHVKMKLAAVAAISMAVGAVGGGYLQAQTAAPPAYLVAEVQVTDQDAFKQYLAALPATFAPYKVRTLARGVPVAFDGTAPAGSVAVFAFNSMDDLKAFWESPAYQAIIPLRQKSATTRVFIIDGVAP